MSVVLELRKLQGGSQQAGSFSTKRNIHWALSERGLGTRYRGAGWFHFCVPVVGLKKLCPGSEDGSGLCWVGPRPKQEAQRSDHLPKAPFLGTRLSKAPNFIKGFLEGKPPYGVPGICRYFQFWGLEREGHFSSTSVLIWVVFGR